MRTAMRIPDSLLTDLRKKRNFSILAIVSIALASIGGLVWGWFKKTEPSTVNQPCRVLPSCEVTNCSLPAPQEPARFSCTECGKG